MKNRKSVLAQKIENGASLVSRVLEVVEAVAMVFSIVSLLVAWVIMLVAWLSLWKWLLECCQGT